MIGNGFPPKRPLRERKIAFVHECAELESRRLFSVAPLTSPAIVSIHSLATPDSQSVTVDYTITQANLTAPVTLSIERSPTTNAADPQAQTVATAAIDPSATDLSGNPQGAIGEHQLSVPIAGGLPPDPGSPYVIASAASTEAQAEVSATAASASFRTYQIAVVTHGGFESIFYGSHLPPWVMPMASRLKAAGYDAVIPFNWVSRSSDPGWAAKEGDRLARTLLQTMASAPGSGPIDLFLIGHSEGNVVNTVALEDIASVEPARLHQGYVQETLLDPFSANNHVATASFSQNPSILGKFARYVMVGYQHQATDPPIYVPPIVNSSDVYYQHTPFFLEKDVYDHTLNLWGQVPVPGAGKYYNLTGIGIGHTDGVTIQLWYLKNIIPLIEHHYPIVVPQDPLSGGLLPNLAGVRRIQAEGSAAPGAKIALEAIRGFGGTKPVRIGMTWATSDGLWSINTDKLGIGSYRVFAVATTPAGVTKPRTVLVNQVKLGRIDVAPRPRKP